MDPHKKSKIIKVLLYVHVPEFTEAQPSDVIDKRSDI